MPKAKHVLLLMTDQQRYDTIRALGCPQAITPNLDALAADSSVFERCYTPSPVCAPARLSIYSGLYPASHGCSNNSPDLLYRGDGLYGLLTDAGFYTCGIGKMHYVRDLYALHGFRQRITQEELPHPADDYTNFLLGTEYKNVIDYNGQRSEMYYLPQISQLPARFHPTQWIGDRAVEFLREFPAEDPLFLMVSFIHPHPPFAPPVPWNKLQRMEMDRPFIPEDSQNLISYHNYTQNMYKGLSAGVDYHLLTQIKNFYYSCISFVDYQIGRIVETLKTRGLYDDTLILFLSDHGELLGDYQCLGKRSMHEAVSRVPLMIHVPGRDPERRKEVVSLVDIMPTVLRYAGVPVPEGLDGVDLLSGDSGREFVYSQYSNGTTGLYMVASDHDKLVWSAADEKYWYFDEYPERVNRYDEASPRCAQMRELLTRYLASDRAENPEDCLIDMEQVRRDYRYTLVKQDSVARSKDERALLPPGYDLDLSIEYFCKRARPNQN